ncbi:hypothetical protein ACIGZJ_14925 [Kitasatospora sp. NPDC052868]|uniref:hypothetical protein n=1 Tax=Kitasatospora sp. NPDC052868 TaxID=3364060 RepID=UPI0037CACB53
MPLVLVEGALLRCSHGGQSRLLGGDQRVTVRGLGVLTGGAETGFVFGGTDPPPPPNMVTPCPIRTPDGSKAVPCTIAVPAAPPGLARTLTVGGTPVLLAAAGGPTVSVPVPGTWSVADPGQTVLEAS